MEMSFGFFGSTVCSRAAADELTFLNDAEWRNAEEVAHIADDLLTPESVSQRISRMREGMRTSDVA